MFARGVCGDQGEGAAFKIHVLLFPVCFPEQGAEPATGGTVGPGLLQHVKVRAVISANVFPFTNCRKQVSPLARQQRDKRGRVAARDHGDNLSCSLI